MIAGIRQAYEWKVIDVNDNNPDNRVGSSVPRWRWLRLQPLARLTSVIA
jgi:hypothetical protein